MLPLRFQKELNNYLSGLHIFLFLDWGCLVLQDPNLSCVYDSHKFYK